jgi:hypothetical protein
MTKLQPSKSTPSVMRTGGRSQLAVRLGTPQPGHRPHGAVRVLDPDSSPVRGRSCRAGRLGFRVGGHETVLREAKAPRGRAEAVGAAPVEPRHKAQTTSGVLCPRSWSNCSPAAYPGHRLPFVALVPQWRQDYLNNRPPTRATAISAMGHKLPCYKRNYLSQKARGGNSHHSVPLPVCAEMV